MRKLKITVFWAIVSLELHSKYLCSYVMGDDLFCQLFFAIRIVLELFMSDIGNQRMVCQS